MFAKLSVLLRCLAITVFASMPVKSLAEDHTPQEVVANLIAAMEAGKADDIRDSFAESASQAYGAGAPKTGDDFRAWLESDIIEAEGRVENAELNVDGQQVIVTGRYRNANGYSSDADFLMTVEGRQITSWQMGY